MGVGESATATLEARRRWNDTGITLVAGQEYQFRAEGTWIDWFVTCDAEGYESINAVQRLSESLRRAPSERWFALMGTIDRDTRGLFHIGREAIFSPCSSGVLCCFANDVSLAYWNNFGAIRLTVTRAK
jgi:hypothetical protein